MHGSINLTKALNRHGHSSLINAKTTQSYSQLKAPIQIKTSPRSNQEALKLKVHQSLGIQYCLNICPVKVWEQQTNSGGQGPLCAPPFPHHYTENHVLASV